MMHPASPSTAPVPQRRQKLVIACLLVISLIYLTLTFLAHFNKPNQPRVSQLFVSLRGNDVWMREWQKLKTRYSDNPDALEEDIERLNDADKVFDDELDTVIHDSHSDFIVKEEGLQTDLDALYNKLNGLLDKHQQLFLMQSGVFKFQQNVASEFGIMNGYSDRDADEETHPADPNLLDKILKRVGDYPRFVRDNTLTETDWRFENIIHQTWVDTEIPDMAKNWVQKWKAMHPDWTYMYWTDDSAREFVRDYYPSLLAAYDSWILPVQRADMFRYIALYAFGGVFADIDMEPLRSMDSVRDWSSCVFARETDIQTYIAADDLNTWANDYTVASNALMACRSHHPFMYYLISRTLARAPANSPKPCYFDDTSLCSGSLMVSLAYGFYKRSLGSAKLQDKMTGVVCPEHDWFNPVSDPELGKEALEKCKESSELTPIQRFICKSWEERDYKNTPKPQSYTYHHWMHSHHHPDLSSKSSDIRQVVKNVLIWSNEVKMKHFVMKYR